MELVFASHNLNKVREVKPLMPKSIHILGLDDIGCTEPIVEDASTIEGNALLKALYVKERYGYDCFADDTGLEVAALHGAPGVYSARFAGPDKNSEDNIKKLLDQLADKDDRTAQFRTVIALCIGRESITFQGVVKGSIIDEKRGDGGFGYDPVFVPTGYHKTFSELSLEEKNNIAHRGIAVCKLIDYLRAKHPIR